MKIWLINHYAVPPQFYPLARPSLFAKNLIKMGHDVTIIAASTVHNSDKNLITDNEKVKKFTDDGIPYILIKCSGYKGNGAKRVINILEFAQKLPKVMNTLERPDAIVATSFDPFTCYEGIKYAKKHGIKAVAEIADLWPETLVAISGISPKNPFVKYLRKIEKNIYTTADRVVYTMEGAYDYIIEQGWEKIVPRDKVEFINNGIDLDEFDFNVKHNQIEDEDLEDPDTFKVVYAGAIRKVNNVMMLVDAAVELDSSVQFLIWGDGDQLEEIRDIVKEKNIKNVKLKGRVQKKYVPFITSKADLNIIHGEESPVIRFGMSLNKMFDSMAAGRVILVDIHSPYDPAVDCGAAIECKNDSHSIAEAIKRIVKMEPKERNRREQAARQGAEKYDFKYLTSKLVDVIQHI